MEQTKILVVDDEARMRKLVKDFLTIKGYQVLEAGDGEEAVEIFFQQKGHCADLTGCDDAEDGWMGRCREPFALHSKVPIIMLTARARGAGRASGI